MHYISQFPGSDLIIFFIIREKRNYSYYILFSIYLLQTEIGGYYDIITWDLTNWSSETFKWRLMCKGLDCDFSMQVFGVVPETPCLVGRKEKMEKVGEKVSVRNCIFL